MQQYVRLTERRRFATPVVAYTHPATGRRITLIGLMHIGLPEYFTNLATLISTLEEQGAQVVVEGPPPASDSQQRPVLTDQQQNILKQYQQAMAAQFAAYGALGWVEQGLGLPPSPTWQILNTTPEEDIVLAAETIQARAEQTAASMRMLTAHPNLFHIGTAVTFHNLARAGTTIKPTTHQAIWDRTNQIVIHALDTTDRDMVVAWGARHLPDLIAHLTEHGYQLTHPAQWHTAVQLPSIWAALGRILIRRRPRDLTPGQAAPPDHPHSPQVTESETTR